MTRKTSQRAVVPGWHDWRPAIWLTMLGIAVMLLVSPFYLGAVFIGAGVGASLRIRQRRRQAANAASRPARPRAARRGGERKRQR